ncbi:MAG: hypothetical protein WC466_05380 [Candidatus Izemoplasmatales bacterium]
MDIILPPFEDIDDNGNYIGNDDYFKFLNNKNINEDILKLELSEKTDEFIDKRTLSFELNMDVLLTLKSNNELEIFFEQFKKEFNQLLNKNTN